MHGGAVVVVSGVGVHMVLNKSADGGDVVGGGGATYPAGCVVDLEARALASRSPPRGIIHVIFVWCG